MVTCPFAASLAGRDGFVRGENALTRCHERGGHLVQS